jgi:hypothetical protein
VNAVDTSRREGQPGTVSIGKSVRGVGRHFGLTYPAVRTSAGEVWYWRDTTRSAGQWLQAYPSLADTFEAGPDWQEHCPHEHGAPWRTCDSEADCIALKREEGGD